MLHTLLTLSILGAAAPPLPIAVEVDPSFAAVAPLEDIRQAVGRELSAPVAEQGSTAPTRGRLEVRRVAVERARLVWRDATGRESTREVDLAPDGSAPQVIALLTGTLARNEVDELIAEGGPTVSSAEVRQVAPEVAAPPTFRRFVLGLDAHFSTVGITTGTVTYSIPGIETAYRVTPWLKVGLISTTLSAENWRWAVSTAPFGEVSLRWWRLEPFAQLGAFTQVRFGNGLKTAGGLAPFAGVGARIWLGERFSVAVGVRLYAVATDYIQLLTLLLPQGAVMLTGGVELGVSL